MSRIEYENFTHFVLLKGWEEMETKNRVSDFLLKQEKFGILELYGFVK